MRGKSVWKRVTAAALSTVMALSAPAAALAAGVDGFVSMAETAGDQGEDSPDPWTESLGEAEAIPQTEIGTKTAREAESAAETEGVAEIAAEAETETIEETEGETETVAETEREAIGEPETAAESEWPTEGETEAKGETPAETEEAADSGTLMETEEAAGSGASMGTEAAAGLETVMEMENGDLFPGLGSDFQISSSMKEDKAVLRSYSDEVEEAGEESYVPGEVIVSVESREEAEKYAEAFGGELLDYMEGAGLISLQEDRTVEQAVKASSDPGTLLPAAWPNYYDYPDDSYESGTDSGSYYIEEDSAVDGNAVGNYDDPYLVQTSGNYQYYHNMISSGAAWQQNYTGEGVKVAVLDTGIIANHEDVYAKALDNGRSGSDNYGYYDSDGHGTHVAGIIGAKLGNGKGGSGVAPGVELVSIKVLGSNGGSHWSIMGGIQKAMEEDADIINMSLGGSNYSSLYEEKVDEAYEAGIAVFAAAGNESTNAAHYPAAYESAISVAALNENTGRAYFSNYGSTVDYCAPGVGIASTYCDSSSGYEKLNGTSQAAPIVSGTAAVLLASSASIQGKTGKARVDALCALMNKGVVKASAAGVGKGYIDLAKALGISTVLTAPKAPVFQTQNGKEFAGEYFYLRIAAENGMQIYYTTNGKTVSYKNGLLSAGAEEYGGSILINGASKVTVKAIAVNPANGLASKAVSATYYLKPKVRSITLSPPNGVSVLAKGTSLQLTAEIAPAYAANKALAWSVSPAGQGVTVTAKGKVAAQKNAEPGVYTVTATAKDQGGNYGQLSVTVPESAAEITSVKAQKTSVSVYVGNSVSCAVTVKKGKDKGSVGEVRWTSADPSVAQAAVDSESESVIITGYKSGKTTITGRALDGSGRTVKITAKVKQYAESITIIGDSKVARSKSITLKAQVYPSDTSNKKVKWSMVNPKDNLVTVSSSGKVTAKAKASGVYTVKATSADGSKVYGTKRITVLDQGISKITLGKKSARIFRVGNDYGAPTLVRIPLEVEGGDGTQLWKVTSTNPGIATVDLYGSYIKVTSTGNSTGKVKVTVSATDGSGKKASCTVTVGNPVTKLQISPQSGRVSGVARGTSLKLSAVLESAGGKLDAAGKKVKWTSDNSKITVDSAGKVTVTKKAYAGSVAIITAKAADGSGAQATYQVQCLPKTTSFKKQVYEKYADATQYILYPKSGSQRIDNTMKYCAVEVKGNAVTANLTWYTDCIILNVYEQKKGSSRITVKCLDGSSAKCTFSYKTRIKK